MKTYEVRARYTFAWGERNMVVSCTAKTPEEAAEHVENTLIGLGFSNIEILDVAYESKSLLLEAT